MTFLSESGFPPKYRGNTNAALRMLCLLSHHEYSVSEHTKSILKCSTDLKDKRSTHIFMLLFLIYYQTLENLVENAILNNTCGLGFLRSYRYVSQINVTTETTSEINQAQRDCDKNLILIRCLDHLIKIIILLQSCISLWS